MTVFYFDRGAIVKRYADESGSAWIAAITEPGAGNALYLVRVTKVEVLSAITRRTRAGSLSPSEAAAGIAAFQYDFDHNYRIVEITAELIEHAVLLIQAHVLRGYDAIQLAAALEINAERSSFGLPSITLISADSSLNTAAAAEGLAVDNPNSHP